MFKVISLFSLKEGIDEEKAWAYELGPHGQVVKNTPGLIRYVVSRVKRAMPMRDGKTASPEFWIMVEMVWESEAAHNEAFKYIPADEMPTFVSNPRALIVEEVVLK